MPKRKLTRKERIARFQMETYVQASFFGMNGTGAKQLDEKINEMVKPLPEMPNEALRGKLKAKIAKEAWQRRRIERGNSM